MGRRTWVRQFFAEKLDPAEVQLDSQKLYIQPDAEKKNQISQSRRNSVSPEDYC